MLGDMDVHVMGGMKAAWFRDPDGNSFAPATPCNPLSTIPQPGIVLSYFAMAFDYQRQRIDEANTIILDALAQRMDASLKIGVEKIAEGIPLHDPVREAAVLDAFVKGAVQRGLSEEFARELMSVILEESRRLQASQSRQETRKRS